MQALLKGEALDIDGSKAAGGAGLRVLGVTGRGVPKTRARGCGGSWRTCVVLVHDQSIMPNVHAQVAREGTVRTVRTGLGTREWQQRCSPQSPLLWQRGWHSRSRTAHRCVQPRQGSYQCKRVQGGKALASLLGVRSALILV